MTAPPKPTTTPKGCACPKIYKPVCGQDGKQYGNSCIAKCEKVVDFTDGPCPSPKTTKPIIADGFMTAPPKPTTTPKGCACPKIYKPVCGKDGKQYGNSCIAKCQKVVDFTDGPCPSPKTTTKPIIADGFRTAPPKPTTTPKGCPCPKIFKPVCGKDGNQYGNSCIAKCKKVVDFTDGPCPSPKTTTKKPIIARGFRTAPPKPTTTPK